MISFIKGNVEHVDIVNGIITLDCNGVGYSINVTTSLIGSINLQDKVKIFTYMQVRDDAFTLYGFSSRDDLDMFKLLTSVSGVGAKAGISLLSVFNPSQLVLALVSDDAAALAKAPGIGKKTAQRLILELRDKIKSLDAFASDSSVSNITQFNSGDTGSVSMGVSSGAKRDAIEALIALGYGRSEAVKSVMEAATEEMTTEQIIKVALKKLAMK